MIVWWSDNHPRLEAERAAITALSDRETWLENIAWSFDDCFRMQAVFEIRMDYGVFPLKLIYHSTFPNTAPSVRPVDPSRLSGHQYGNGDLCLEIRPDNWRPEFTGDELIQSAFNLLETERPDPEGIVKAAPSAHNVPETIAMRNTASRLYLSEKQLEMLRNEAPAFCAAKLWQQWCGVSYIIVHISELSQGEWSWKDKDTPATLGNEALTQTAVVVKTDKSERALKGVVTKQHLIDVLDIDPTLDEPAFYCLVVPSEGLPILFRQIADAGGMIRYRTLLAPSDQQNRGGDLKDQLEGLRVGIVGLGSVGSKVATSLARAGVGRFDLIDDDILHPGNIERHDGDWRDVGLHKVDLTKRRIELISNSVKVTARRVSIGAQVSPTEMATVDGALGDCDIIIDATANASVLNHLTAISLDASNSLVWGGIYAGGIGGYIARSRPERDPSPHLIRQALNDFYEGVDEAPPVPTGEGYDAHSSEEVYVASDSDVSLFAAYLTSFALDTICKSEPSDYDAPLYLIGFRRAWIFESAFHVQPVTIEAPLRPKKEPAIKDTAQSKFIDDLVKKKLHEITNRKADT